MLSSQTSFYYGPLMPFVLNLEPFQEAELFFSTLGTLRSVFSFIDYGSVSQLGQNEHICGSVSYYKYTLFTTVATDRMIFGQCRVFAFVLDERHM